MVTRDALAGASAKAFLVVLACSCASIAFAASRAPFRERLAEPPPIVSWLAAEVRSAPAPSESFVGDLSVSPLLPIVAPHVAAEADADFDVAAALIPAEARAFADALDVWAHRASGERLVQRKAIAEFYAARVYRPLWREGERWRAEASAVVERLRLAGEDGLDLRAYPIPEPGAQASAAADEVALTEAVVAYATQAAGGRVDPRRVSRLIGARPPLPEPGAILSAIAAAGERAGDRLQDYNPPHAGYRALKEKLVELRGARGPEAPTRYAESRSVARDDSPAEHKRRATPAAPQGARLRAEIIANMERWRWLPRDLGGDRIEVNIPDFELAVVRDGEVTHRARVIVGKEGTPTPVFSDAMQFIIVNPYWNVPPSILNKEMLPKFGGDLQAIAAHGYEVVYRNGQARVRQRPGEGNALGRIKFMFPNDFSVYLHDTPSRGLFSAAHRAFSHGCVRVDQPFRLAEAVLGPDSGWREDRVKKLIGGSERYINLMHPLPIHIEYFTAFVDTGGRLRLRGDLYGYSAKVRAALGLEG
ncbi:murein L,D-transpeptidase [Methylosinus sp. Sm6]|uniref:L,D-transpeptidase family protein n=1 Tax=Methylosinus sp. Sm6 TaxID=2866948 RepID=UPI001C995E18|nr:L,D-transpeptidase family protein [Methylosinus sp. Sm6]MBY6242261.1 L,D-transpeptidase family protein [Methylosinus sp. Sm6]